MRRRVTAIVLGLALTGGLTACGGASTVHDVAPKTVPDLIAPTNVSLGGAAASSSNSTSTTSTTSTTPSSTTPPTTSGTSGTSGTGA
ncbi:MAG: hypothetical protein QOF86_3739, partial [Baekduia sp.]|nr:hypothetical protein [Baekduia sp.]